MNFTTNKALISAGVAITSSIIGLLVAFGVMLAQNQRDAIIGFITVALPAALGFIGWLHHGHIQLRRDAASDAAWAAIKTTAAPSPTPPAA